MSKKITELPQGNYPKVGEEIELVQLVTAAPTSRRVAMDLIIPAGDLAPTTKNALDDEFDNAATLPSGGSAQWAWVNQGTSSISVGGSSLKVVVPAVNAQNVRGIYQSLPSAPYEFVTKVLISGSFSISHQIGGLMLYDSVSGKVNTIGIGFSTTHRMRIDNWTTTSSFSAQPYTRDCAGLFSVYLKVADDTTNRKYYCSLDGINYYPVYSVGNTSFVTPNKIGLFWYYEQTTDQSNLSFPFFRRTI